MNTQAIINNQSENTNNMEMTNDQLMTRFFDLVEQIKERGIDIPVIENENKVEKPENVITTTITKKVSMILAINGMTGNEIGKFPYNKKTFESFEIDGMNFKKFQEEIQKKGVVSKAIKNGDKKTWANMTIIQVEQKDVPQVSITTGGKHNGGSGVCKPCKLYDRVLNKVTYWDSVRQMVNILFKGGESTNFCRNARENTELGVDIVNDDNTLFILKKRYAVSYL